MPRKKRTSPAAPASKSVAHPSAKNPPTPIKHAGYNPDEYGPALPPLTVREEEVHYWVVRGKENDEVAKILQASPETIRKHVENIRRKLGVESRLAVISSYWQREIEDRDRIIDELRRQQPTKD